MGYGWFPVRSDGPAQQNLTDRSTRIRGDIDLRACGALERQQGDNQLSEQRTNGSAEQ